MQRLLFVLLALATATPAAAQEWLVNRERFRYIGTRLTVEVLADAPGSIRILRGQNGWIAVAGRVPTGFAAAGLTDDDRLTLSAVGDGPVDYMLTVPEGVRVVVRLPDRRNTEWIGGHTRLRTLDWGRTADATTTYGTSPEPGVEAIQPGGEVAPGLFTTYAASLAPATVALPDLRAVRRVTVRTGATRFRIATTRPLSLEPGSTAIFEIRPTGEPMDIVIEIPDGTAAFSLTTAGAAALTIDGSTVTARCEPVVRQWLSAGEEWVTFTPREGQLNCGVVPSTRHIG